MGRRIGSGLAISIIGVGPVGRFRITSVVDVIIGIIATPDCLGIIIRRIGRTVYTGIRPVESIV